MDLSKLVGRGAVAVVRVSPDGEVAIDPLDWQPLYPPGPFPPHGHERKGSVDLGVRLRDSLFNRALVVGPVRRVLHDAVQRVMGSPDRVLAAIEHVDALLDTWPLGAMVDQARETWTDHPDGDALAVLVRCTEVMGPVLGWPRTVDRRWPLPDEDWMRQQLEPGVSYAVVPRGPRDGSAASAVALGLPLAAPDFVALPNTCIVQGDELVGRLTELLAMSAAGTISGVEFEGYTPHDEQTQQAQAALRGAMPGQAAMDRYGLAGLSAGRAPTWSSLLKAAPAGAVGPCPVASAEGRIVPGIGPNREVVERGVLLWDEAYRPVRVHPAAVEVLRHLDGRRGRDEVAAVVGAPPSLVWEIIVQLVELGAATT